MIEIISQYEIEKYPVATAAKMNELINDGYTVMATLNGWGFHDDYYCDGKIILHKPDEDPTDTREFPELKALEPGDDLAADVTFYPDTLEGFKQMVADGDFVVLDTETTGLHDGEICQIAIIDADGETVLKSYVNTVEPIPAEATRIHGITDAHVRNAPTWAELQPKVRAILRGKNVVIYNAKYDRKMMHRSDERSALPRVNYKEEATYWCAMEHYAEFWGEKRYGSFTWQKLTAAADQQGVVVENAHDALGDCLMTLGVIRSMAGVEVPAEV